MEVLEEESEGKQVTRIPANQPDVYVRCPYFPEHELRKSRLPYHIMKCQNNPKAPQLLACPYNYLHRVPPDKCREHILTCEDKIMTRYSEREPPSFGRTVERVWGKQRKYKIDLPSRTKPAPPKVPLDCGEEEWV